MCAGVAKQRDATVALVGQPGFKCQMPGNCGFNVKVISNKNINVLPIDFKISIGCFQMQI